MTKRIATRMDITQRNRRAIRSIRSIEDLNNSEIRFIGNSRHKCRLSHLFF